MAIRSSGHMKPISMWHDVSGSPACNDLRNDRFRLKAGVRARIITCSRYRFGRYCVGRKMMGTLTEFPIAKLGSVSGVATTNLCDRKSATLAKPTPTGDSLFTVQSRDLFGRILQDRETWPPMPLTSASKGYGITISSALGAFSHQPLLGATIVAESLSGIGAHPARRSAAKQIDMLQCKFIVQPSVPKETL
jgi:hypothetical protein